MNAEHDKKWLVARRDFLRSSAALGVAAAYGLAPTQGLAQGVPLQFDGSQFMLKPAEANAKRGGVLRICVLSRQPHFDVHQSGHLLQHLDASMHVRQSDPPRSARQREVDHSRSRTQLGKPDGTSYTFFLRRGHIR
jgi:peptide/nickel transport system substrate-binding protein